MSDDPGRVASAPQYQDLSRFVVPPKFRGRSVLVVQLWWLVQTVFFHTSPQVSYKWRAWLLRIFGAQIGRGVIIRPSVSVVYPWKLSIGDFSWIGDDAVLYSLGEITVGSNTVLSQGCYLCAGSHDATDVRFTITNDPIHIADQCWLASDVFVLPGVSIGEGTVVAARSTVTRSLPGGVIAMGSPARVVGQRFPSEEAYSQGPA